MYSIHGEKGIKPLQIIQRHLISVKVYRRSVGESAEYIHKCLLKVVPCEDRQTKYLFFRRGVEFAQVTSKIYFHQIFINKSYHINSYQHLYPYCAHESRQTRKSFTLYFTL